MITATIWYHMPNFYRHKKTFFRNGVWIKDATTQDNSSVEINAELDDCARDESLDPSEVKNVLDVPLENFGSIEDGNLCMLEEDMHFNENPDSPEGLLDLPSVSDAMSSGFSWSPLKQSLQMMMTLTVKRQSLQMSRTMKILILQKMLTLKQIKPMVMTLGSYL